MTVHQNLSLVNIKYCPRAAMNDVFGYGSRNTQGRSFRLDGGTEDFKFHVKCEEFFLARGYLLVCFGINA
ncbi:Protein of unknown function [Gryllus bimaculatus]|nr:Protein of unknown function [Gryllus bimaculatus]